MLDGPGEPNRLEFEFGPGNAEFDGFSEMFPSFGFKHFVMKQTHRVFKLEIIVQHASLLAYFKAAQERLDPRFQGIPEQLIQAIHRYLGGIAKTSHKRERQILWGEVTPPSDLHMGQVVPIPLCLKALDLFYARRQPLTPAMEPIFGQVLSCPYQGANRRRYLEDQVLELIALYLRALESRQSYENDFSYVYEAASILRQDLVRPPSMDTLVRQVCTNRLKLNQGFHRVYGTTPYRYLRDCRLAKAGLLMQRSDSAIENIVAAVGYKNRSHFALAFRQLTGMNPKDFQLQSWRMDPPESSLKKGAVLAG